jgi:D-alanyl-D-alanine carboxypeptidase/D-alanyl-D-alanine-endopeptidase (penicillin-binding protein 4)
VARLPRAVFVTLLTAGALAGYASGAQAGGAPAQRATSTTAAPLVLPPAKAEGAAPTATGVQKALAAALKDPSLGKHFGAYVYDASRGRPVFSVGTAKPFVPASTMKLLTTVAVLEALGPDHRFTTKVVRPGPASIVLVGGGDPLLTGTRPADPTSFPTRASLQDLAASTAKALLAEGVRTVTLSYDASLFTGPAANAKWQPNYLTEGIAARTSALWINEGRVTPGMAKRADSPALAAATSFAAQLRAAGIKATGLKSTVAPPASTPVAQVNSASLGDLVEHVNLHSDNDGAEVLLRHVGLATENGGSYTGGIKGLRTTLTKLGIDVTKARFEDGSGLSRTNLVPLDVLAGAVRVAASPDHPTLRHLITGLPVAGFNGSLNERFAGPGTATGTGMVRAKTGTLTSIHSLAGLARSRSGTLLVFAVATDSSPAAKALDARAALDRAASALAACGC